MSSLRELGDSGPSGESSNDSNPWGKDTLTVGVKQKATAQQDFLTLVEQALEYWGENSETYTGYDISFRFRPNTDNPDVLVVLVEEILECGEHTTEEYAGCASVEFSEESSGRVRVVSGYDSEYTLNILKHEFGHIVGLDHGDEPAHIMSDDIEDRIPDYNDRNQILEFYTNSFDPISEGNTHWDELIAHWENEDYEEAETEAMRAEEDYQSAADLLTDAVELSEEIEEQAAVDICDEAYWSVEYLRRAAEEAILMAREMAAGNRDAAEEHRAESNSYLEKSDEYEIAGSGELADALGIPTRDE